MSVGSSVSLYLYLNFKNQGNQMTQFPFSLLTVSPSITGSPGSSGSFLSFQEPGEPDEPAPIFLSPTVRAPITGSPGSSGSFLSFKNQGNQKNQPFIFPSLTVSAPITGSSGSSGSFYVKKYESGAVSRMAGGSCGGGRDRGLIPRFLVVLVRTSTSSDTIQTAHTNFF